MEMLILAARAHFTSPRTATKSKQSWHLSFSFSFHTFTLVSYTRTLNYAATQGEESVVAIKGMSG